MQQRNQRQTSSPLIIFAALAGLMLIVRIFFTTHHAGQPRLLLRLLPEVRILVLVRRRVNAATLTCVCIKWELAGHFKTRHNAFFYKTFFCKKTLPQALLSCVGDAVEPMPASVAGHPDTGCCAGTRTETGARVRQLLLPDCWAAHLPGEPSDLASATADRVSPHDGAYTL